MKEKSEVYPRLGKNIRGLRKMYGERITDLAEFIGVEPSAVSYYETGQRFPKLDTLKKLAKHFRVSETQLLTGDLSDLPYITGEKKRDSLSTLMMIFPLVCTETALEHKAFKKGYEIMTQEVYPHIGKGMASEDDYALLQKCIALFEMAKKGHIVEGTANHLSLLMLLGFGASFLSPRMSDSIDIKGNRKTMRDVWESILPTFKKTSEEDSDAGQTIEESSEEDVDTSPSIEEFLKEYEVDIYVDIALLKKTESSYMMRVYEAS